MVKRVYDGAPATTIYERWTKEEELGKTRLQRQEQSENRCQKAREEDPTVPPNVKGTTRSY